MKGRRSAVSPPACPPLLPRAATSPGSPRLPAKPSGSLGLLRARQIGLDAATFSGHSLRAGIVTSGAAHGVEERVLMRQTRHRSAAVLRGYIRDAELLGADNVSGRVGL